MTPIPAPTARRITLATIIGVLVLWEAATTDGGIPPYLLPAPHAIVLRAWHELQTSMLWVHIWATASVAGMAVLIATIGGMLVGWLSFHNITFRAATRWFLTSTQAIPVIAVAPLLFLWVANEYWARVGVAVVITFFPAYAATETALLRIPRELREVASIEGVTIWNGWLWYEAALAAPVILAGMRTSMVLATTGAVVGEYLGGRYGLGALINIARGLFDTTLVFVAVVILIVLTSLSAWLFHTIETHVLRRYDA